MERPLNYKNHLQSEIDDFKNMEDMITRVLEGDKESVFESDITFLFDTKQSSELFLDWFYDNGGEDSFWDYLEEYGLDKDFRFKLNE